MITKQQMTELEDKAEKRGTSKLTLMENAGRKVAEVLNSKLDLNHKKVLIVCYHGNNGGDGFVAARYLAEKTEVEVLFIGDETKFKPEAEINFRKIEEDPAIQFIGLDYVDFDEYDVIIDAILGTGIKGELKPHIQSAIDGINAARGFKVSVDIPSGMDPDTGLVEDRAVNPDLIVTFHDMKPCHENFKDKTVVVDIGIPKDF
jgi:NAD(P)H-hydrate epimerase